MPLLENETIAVDESAWPSSYYGKCQRVDLEKFFQKVQQEQLEQQQLDDERDRQRKQERTRHQRRRVSFDPDPPTVCVYEPEYDMPTTNCFELHSSKDTWPSYARRPPHRLDLRPIRNEHYGQPTTTPSPSSQYSPTTPPLSPCSPSLLNVDVDSSDDDDDQPATANSSSTISPWLPASTTATTTTTTTTTTTSPSTPPFSPATLTKKLTAVFSRRRRSQ